MSKVLVVEDDAPLAAMISEYLGRVGMTVETAPDGARGLDALARHEFDAVVLDLMLPDLDGLEVCRRIRAGSAVPVLMLTARGEPMDRIVGLELGADDYLPKPFEPRELLARLRAVLRRTAGAPPATARQRVRFGRLEIDADARRITLDGAVRTLTGHQFDLLWALASHAGRVMSRDRLLDSVRGQGAEAFDRSVDVHVSRIRAAVEDDPRHPRRIITVRGAGYVFAREQD